MSEEAKVEGVPKSKDHHILTEFDHFALDMMKNIISQGIKELKDGGLRSANIEIELMTHIKKELKDH